jgi:NTP pyrophosphatase (non-canonical NTP hydrolase)
MSMRELIDDEPDWFEDGDLSLTFYEYSEAAMNTAIYPNHLIYPLLGLVGEAGEVAEKVKKLMRDEVIPPDGGEPVHDLNLEQRIEIAKELGDVLWYLTAVANDLGFDLDEIANMNMKKLASRKRRGRLRGNGDNR